MQVTLTKPRKGRQPLAKGVYETKITGRFTPIAVHQLAIAWWLYRTDHITRQQFRIYFAAQEMKERRRYTKPDPDDPRNKPRRPSYTLDEIKSLIGSKGTGAADKALSADVKKLGRLGLVKISHRSIEFATSIEQIALDDVAGFWDFFNQLPNTRRTVPMPRRTSRALAKGFGRGVSGLMIALMIRSLYWHRPRNSASDAGEQGGASGRYRIDGRTKCSWVADVFALDRKTVSNARRQLIDRGWLVPIDCPQWELNKWGQRYTLNVHAFGPPEVAQTTSQTFSKAASRGGEIPSRSAKLSGVFPSPCLNTSAFSIKKDLITRKPDPTRSGCGSVGSRKKKIKLPPPRISNVRCEDLGDPERMNELHRQAIEKGYDVRGEKGRIDFFALAERAVKHGNSAPRLFVWLLKNGRFDYITNTEEDAAIARMKRLSRQNSEQRSELDAARRAQQRKKLRHQDHFRRSLGPDERFVQACLIIGRQRGLDAYRIAQAQGWTRERWETAHMSYEHAERMRWRSDEIGPSGFTHLMDDTEGG